MRTKLIAVLLIAVGLVVYVKYRGTSVQKATVKSCVPGMAWSGSSLGGPSQGMHFNGRVIGPVQFKSATYCKVQLDFLLGDGGYSPAQYIYYSEDQSDIWMVMSSADGEPGYELHLSNIGR